MKSLGRLSLRPHPAIFHGMVHQFPIALAAADGVD